MEWTDKYTNATYVNNPDGSITWILAKKKKKKQRQPHGDISDIRMVIFSRDNNQCYYCHSSINLVLDHVMPKPIFQWHDPYNLITCCLRCNFKKGTKILIEPHLSEVLSYLKRANKIFNREILIELTRRLTIYYNGE